MFKEIKTYGDLLAYLSGLTGEQLGQNIQVVDVSTTENDVHECERVIAAGTVKSLGFEYVRSANNNKYNPNEIVLLKDSNPYGLEGAMAYDWKDDGTFIPDFGTQGYDPAADWTGPAQKLLNEANTV